MVRGEHKKAPEYVPGPGFAIGCDSLASNCRGVNPCRKAAARLEQRCAPALRTGR